MDKEDHQEKLQGAVFEIRKLNSNSAGVNYLETWGTQTVTTDDEGMATVSDLGPGYYEIRDGVGYNWYGIKEAFGGEGSYETMTFDEEGTERVFLQSYYAYTLSINVRMTERTGDDVYSESIDWDKFVVD